MPFLCECSYQLIVHLCRETLVESREFHGDRNRRLAFFVDESQRFEGGFYDAGNEFRLLLDQLICGCHRSPGVLHFVTDENQFSKTAGSAGIAFTRRRNDGINGACHKGSNGVSCPSRVDERKVPVNFKPFNSGLLRIQLRTLSFVARMTLRGAPPLATLTSPMVPAILN